MIAAGVCGNHRRIGMRKRVTLAAAFGAVLAAIVYPGAAGAHLHPFNPAAACAPERTGAGNEATSFFFAPGIVEHWDVTDLRPDIPGVQFLITISNPGKSSTSQGAIAVPAIFAGNPGVFPATTHCA
jgi:hypothetical protein